MNITSILRKASIALAFVAGSTGGSLLLSEQAVAASCKVNFIARNLSPKSRALVVMDFKGRASAVWHKHASYRNPRTMMKVGQGQTTSKVETMPIFGCSLKRAIRVYAICPNYKNRHAVLNIDGGRYIRPRDVKISVDCEAPTILQTGLKQVRTASAKPATPAKSHPQPQKKAGTVRGFNCAKHYIQGCFKTTHGKTRSTDWIRFNKNGTITWKTCNRRTGKCRKDRTTLACNGSVFTAAYNGRGYRQYYSFAGRDYQSNFARRIVWNIQTTPADRSKKPSYVSSTFVQTRNAVCR